VAGLTLVKKLLFHARFQRPTKCVFADEFKVLGDVVHLLPFQISNNDEDVVASMIVHSPQEHQFRKLLVNRNLRGMEGSEMKRKIPPL
jgi:hypothetical protein